ncbi:hypothetical protein V6N13_009254 [Hibiscus sabdariffa]
MMGEKKLAVGIPLLSRLNKLCETCVIAKRRYRQEGVNEKKKIPEFTIMDPFYSDEANDVTKRETRAENVTPPEETEIPTGGEASPSTYSPTTHEATSPQVTNTPVRLRSLADIYANTKEVAGIEEEEIELMMIVSEESTCY